MLLSIAVQLTVSFCFKYAFCMGYVPLRFDVFHCFEQKERETAEEQTSITDL